MRYRVIFLDWYMTLSDSLFWEDWATDTDKQKDLVAIQSVMFSNEGRLANVWMRGGINSEEAVKEICKIAKLDEDMVLQGLISSCKNMELNNDNLLSTIEDIRRLGTEVVIATDNMDTFIRWTVPSLRLERYFDGIIDSFTQKALKADFDGETSLFFNDYLQTSKTPPEKMVLIDDRADAVTVEQAGINFYRFDRKTSLSKTLRRIAG